MESHILTLALDIVLVGLLAAVILFGLRLNRHLAALRQSREELKGLLEDFARSTDRAEAALDGLKRGAHENIAAVRKTIDQAEALKDDLTFLAKRGDEVADRLEAGVSGARKLGGPSEPRGARSRTESAPDPGDPAPARRGEGAKARKKSDLLRALQGMR